MANAMLSESLMQKTSRRYHASLEVYCERSSHTSFGARGAELDSREYAHTTGYAVRVLSNKRMGFTSFEREKDFERAVTSARKLSQKQKPDSYYFPPSVRPVFSSSFFDSRAENLDTSELLERLKRMLDAVENAHVEPIQSALSVHATRQELWNSEGLFITQRFSKFSCFSHCSFKGSEADDAFSSWKWGFSPEEVAEHAAFLAKAMHAPRPLSSGNYPVVLDIRALQPFLSLFLGFHLDGESQAKHLGHWKKGSQALPSSLSLYDDPLLPEGEHSAKFDDDGFATKKQALLEKGAVRSFLFDLVSSVKYRGKPGNGFRFSYEAPPKASFSNLVLEGGELGDAVSECGNGVYVSSFLTSGANGVTGDFSFPLLVAFRIRNGQLAEGIRGAMVRGNFFDVLKNAAFEKKPEYRFGLKAGRMKTNLKVVS